MAENFAGDEEGLVSIKSSTVNARLGFIRKVYGILCAQLAITVLICYVSMASKAFARF